MKKRLSLVAVLGMCATVYSAGYLQTSTQSSVPALSTVEGQLIRIVEDFASGDYREHNFVQTSTGERISLQGLELPEHLLTGQPVILNNITADAGHKAVAADTSLIVMGANGAESAGSEGILSGSLGERKVAVLMVNFQDQPSDKPWSAAQVDNNVFTQVNDFIQENSYNQTWLSGNVFGWYTVPVDGYAGSCPSNWDDLAMNMATGAGVNLSGYDHLIFMLPPGSNCSTNAGTIGGSPSRAWISSALDTRVVAHEFSHNLGLYHAHAMDCVGDTETTSCTNLIYGDFLDIMGSQIGHMNAFNKTRLGWLDYGVSPDITTVTSSGTYQISPIASNTNEVKALRIPRGTDASGAQRWYYLEYRQPIGWDSEPFEPGLYKYPENIANGVIIHTATEGDGNSSYLLDMTPETVTVLPGFDLYDAALEVGQSFTDSDAGITVNVVTNDSNGITVAIAMDDQPAPSNTAPVAQNDSATTSESAAVSIAVLANDNDADGDNLSITGTSGVNGSVSISGGNLIFTPNTGFSGVETFSYSISDGNGGSDSANVSVNVTASNNAPVAVNDSASTQANTSVSIAVLANDYDADGDALSITGTSGVNGGVTISGGNLVFTPANGFSGTEIFNYSVTDGQGGYATGSVSVTVSASANNAPLAQNDLVTISSKTSVIIAVLSNDSDPEGDSLSLVSFDQGRYGSVSRNGNQLIYTPGKRFKSSDTFSYTISDGNLSANASVTIQLSDSGSDGTTSGGSKGGGKGGKGPNK
ncbi:Ig-like domain-containing protein [Pontibacter sp. JAM-7]|uniref:Ig-like domain-containing protein n=1 Tax=Pontibacter sp. JAM-7 TaxID=3366581 RepID=UPI003AF61A22